MSRLEHFPKFNKQGVWNKDVLGGKIWGGDTPIRDLRVLKMLC